MFDPSDSRFDVRQLQRRVQTMIARGVVKDIDDALKMQLLDLEMEHGHAPTRVEHWHPYGFSMHPAKGAEVLALALGGNRDHMVVIGTANRDVRLKNLTQGEVAVHDDQGQKVVFRRGGLEVYSDKRVDIGGPGGAKVLTTAGPAKNVYAWV